MLVIVLLLTGAAVYLLTSDYGQPSQPAALIEGRPPVAFVPATFDFGEMPLRTTRSETVLLRNTGSAPLRVQSARSSCACLQANLAPVTIQPGSGVQMPLQINSLSTPGEASFTVSVMFAGYEDPAVLSVRRTTLDE